MSSIHVCSFIDSFIHIQNSITASNISRDENGTDIFRPYSRPNPFRGVLIRPYPSPDI
jgi:hypothetical protein